MSSNDLIYMSAAEIADNIKEKQISPVEVVRAYLDRIEAVDSKVNAYITVMADDALDAARQSEADVIAGSIKGPLHGVPVGVKDQIYTNGTRTSCASKIRADFVPDFDATVVKGLKRSGAIILGKLNMTEFAMGDPITSAFGVTRNPWDLTRNPGTSSTGSGAATASFMCATSLGEDTGGSVRGPAANCGLVGIRPSWGRVSRYGVDGASWSLDTIGPISRTVEDCAITLGAIAGFDENDHYTKDLPVPDYRSALTGNVKGIRVGLVKEFLDSEVMGVTQAVRQGVLDAAKILEDLGAKVELVSIPLAPIAGVASRIISAVERSSIHPEWLREKFEDFHHNTRVAFTTGELIPSQVYYKAQKIRTLVRKQALDALDKYDVLAMPGASEPATVMNLEPGIKSKESAIQALTEASYRGFFSLVSGPALSVGCGFTKIGDARLPLGIQIAGKPFDESTVMNVAFAYQQNTSWHLERPPL
ncbi:MAG TPA: Asp-tRNA(Asn)/Glu-tRNA(Gln) amidotransferase GatCAB subunit A [Dehalococcoidia bacterium]|nr:Asp-tRNA(Asn)/Glu-tRNA(Gln) amidotransferase GatCAB subunit A [Chloroflexota bacterium]HCE76572.1 Asp-tRNA(Asn)/Glu-tRNA(Gln) amidotransferase GatCAB subunit A [Dehalococcoidia bacterium]|tara:strand:- start:328 stop:1755 length:1428 start_codon:yes stop_codon:yes gene_type:complete